MHFKCSGLRALIGQLARLADEIDPPVDLSQATAPQAVGKYEEMGNMPAEPQFFIGDRVVCINNEHYESILTVGGIYTVAGHQWNGELIELAGEAAEAGGLFTSRFEQAPELTLEERVAALEARNAASDATCTAAWDEHQKFLAGCGSQAG